MHLTNKTSLYTVLVVLMVIAVITSYQHYQIRQAANETYRVYMSAIVDTFIEQELTQRYDLLREAGLDKHPRYVERYLEEALEVAEKLSVLNRGTILLLRGDTNISAIQSGNERVIKALQTRHNLTQQSAGFETVDVVSNAGTKQTYLAYWASQPDWGLSVLFVKNDTDLKQAIAGLGMSFIGTSILLILIAILMILAIYNRLIIQPVARLALSAKRIARKDLDFSIDKEGEGELSALSVDMEQMRQELQNYQHLMESWTEELQAEVARQTEDIQRQQAELRRHTVKLEQSNKELEQFAYVASHDLQEPLRMISSFLSLLEKRYKGQLDAKADEYIHFAVDGAERLKRMINDLLAFSRVATQGAPLEPRALSAALQEAISNLRLKIEEQHARIEIEPLPEVMADHSQLVQLFQNLLDNAIKYRSSHTPEIRIYAQPSENSFCLIHVSDNGIGIPDDYKGKVFMVFHRLHNDATICGSGIGLSVCKKIVERHGGEITTKQNETGGTTISFSLLLANPSEAGLTHESN